MNKEKQLYKLLRIVSSHPDWDDHSGNFECEVNIYANKEEAENEAKRLGESNGDATHRAYYHCVRPLTVK